MFTDLLTLSDVKKEPYILENIKWDLEPKTLMEPRCEITETGLKYRGQIRAFMFYIDTMDREPGLFLLGHTAADYAETIAHIVEIPKSLLLEAVEENKKKSYFNMYPINKKIEEWLKKELGL